MGECIGEYDGSVSKVENYLRACDNLRLTAMTLVGLMEVSTINLNGRMGSDQVIQSYIGHLHRAALMVEMLSNDIGIGGIRREETP